MSLLCSTNCGTVADLVNYFDLCAKVKRKSGGSCVGLIKCSYQFTDITDATEWTTAITNGDVFIMPLGKWEIPEPTVNTIEDATGCGIEEIESYSYTIPWESPYSAEDGSDFAFYKAFIANYSEYRAVLIGCDGQVYVSDNYFTALNAEVQEVTVTGSSPGFEFSLTKMYEDRSGTSKNNVKWMAEFKIENSSILCAYPLPDVATAVCG